MGVWDAVREGLGAVLAFFYSLIPNAGVAIILLTVAVRLILFPLTAKQAKSMLAMQRVQPEIKKLQAKYKNDRQKLNEEMMKFYKENEINPLGGCLPLLLQMPIFIALYQTLHDAQKFIPTDSQMFHDVCGGAQTAAQCKNPNMSFAGMDLITTTASAVSKGLADAIPYIILLAIVVGAGFLQQRQTMRNQANVNPSMKIVGRIMPIMFGFFAWNMPAGVALYFATSSLWQIGQQEVVFRTIGTAAGPPEKKKSKGAIGGAGKDAGVVTVEDAAGEPGGAKGGAKGGTAKGGTKGGASKGAGNRSGGQGKSSGQGGARAKPGGSGSSKQGQAGRAGGARSNRKRKR